MNFDKKTATCTVDPKKFVEKKAIQALTDAGFAGSFIIKKKKKESSRPQSNQ